MHNTMTVAETWTTSCAHSTITTAAKCLASSIHGTMTDMDGFLHARQMPTIIRALNTDDDV
jgi:hypothetical protein